MIVLKVHMRLQTFLLGISFLFTPLAFGYAAIVPNEPMFGYRACDLVTLVNNIIKFLFVLGTFVAVLIIAIAGFKSVIAGESAELGSAVWSIVIGFLIMLSGWLVVDTILKVLTGGRIGPWNQVECVNNPSFAESPHVATSPGEQARAAGTIPRGSGVQCDPANTACSPAALQAMGFTQAQSNVMSCIAMTESGGNPNARNPAPNSTACGTFQVVRDSWRGSGSCAGHSSCTDATCNAQAALALMQASRGSAYRDWTCRNCNSRAQGCIDRYDPGG